MKITKVAKPGKIMPQPPKNPNSGKLDSQIFLGKEDPQSSSRGKKKKNKKAFNLKEHRMEKEAGIFGDAFKKAIQWFKNKYPSEFQSGQQIAQQSGGDVEKMAELLGVDSTALGGALEEAKGLQVQASSSLDLKTAGMGGAVVGFIQKHWKAIGIVAIAAILFYVYGPSIADFVAEAQSIVGTASDTVELVNGDTIKCDVQLNEAGEVVSYWFEELGSEYGSQWVRMKKDWVSPDFIEYFSHLGEFVTDSKLY